MLLQQGILQVLKLCAPVLGAALIIGLIVAIFQATTSIQEQTLTFLPKLFTIFIIVALLASFIFTDMKQYTETLFRMIPEMAN